jgi:hypothetical protein
MTGQLVAQTIIQDAPTLLRFLFLSLFSRFAVLCTFASSCLAADLGVCSELWLVAAGSIFSLCRGGVIFDLNGVDNFGADSLNSRRMAASSLLLTSVSLMQYKSSQWLWWKAPGSCLTSSDFRNLDSMPKAKGRRRRYLARRFNCRRQVIVLGSVEHVVVRDWAQRVDKMVGYRYGTHFHSYEIMNRRYRVFHH